MAADNQEQVDKDLDQLLDSALNDFDKHKEQTVVVPKVVAEPSEASPEKKIAIDAKTGDNAAAAPAGADDKSGPWTAEFAQMEEAMKKFLTDQDPQLQEQLSKIAQSASQAASSFNEEEFAAKFQETLETITKSVDQFQPPEGGVGVGGLGGAAGDEMSKLLGAMGLGNITGGEAGGAGGFMQMMQTAMQQLLSKDLLYPALKDLTEKYPKWLEDNKETTSAADTARYEKQLAVMTKVCDAFDEEKDSDSEDVKKERFDRIFKLMHEMQECGNPPPELIQPGEGIPGFAADQLPEMPAPPQECNQQ